MFVVTVEVLHLMLFLEVSFMLLVLTLHYLLWKLTKENSKLNDISSSRISFLNEDSTKFMKATISKEKGFGYLGSSAVRSSLALCIGSSLASHMKEKLTEDNILFSSSCWEYVCLGHFMVKNLCASGPC